MRHMLLPALVAPLLGLTSCGSGGNLKSAADLRGPPPPPVTHSFYNPYAAHGEARATWRPPVHDRDGTIQKPAEPASQWDRPAYEGASWATGAGRSPFNGPPGTF